MPVNLSPKGDIRQALVYLVATASIVAVMIIAALQQHGIKVEGTKDAAATRGSDAAALKGQDGLPSLPQQHDVHAERRGLVEQLQNFYAESVPIFNASLPKNVSQEDFDKFEATFDDWVVRTAAYIEQNMGEAAKARFLDYGPGYSSTWTRAVNEKHNAILNAMWAYQKNLTMLIRSNAWDKLDEAGSPKRAETPHARP